MAPKIAHEMAQQLHAQGETVDLLILIDPNPVGHRRPMRRTINRLGKLMRIDLDKQLNWFLRLRHMYRYVQHVYRCLRYPLYRTVKNVLDGEWGKIKTAWSFFRWGVVWGAVWEASNSVGPGREGKAAGPGHFRDSMFSSPKLCSRMVEALRHDWQGIFFWSFPSTSLSFILARVRSFYKGQTGRRGTQRSGVKWLKRKTKK